MAITADDISQAAFLSAAVYTHSPVDVDAITAGRQIGAGWRLLSYADLGLTQSQWNAETDDATNSPYIYDVGRSQAIVAVRDNQIALAFRGSEPGEIADFSDASYYQSAHYANFATLITAFNSYLAGRNLDVIVTGHSLGAAMAEVYITLSAAAVYSPKLITFGSPGVNSNARGALSVSTITEGAIHFVHTGDPITYARQLVGGGGSLEGAVVQIDLPEFTDGPKSHFGQVINPVNLADFGHQIEEHFVETYWISANDIGLSSRLFSSFIANPGSYDVVRSNQARVDGDSGADYLIGGGAGQTLYGYDGADLIAGYQGSDTVYGGTGADVIEGGSGADRIDGQDDGDRIYGDANDDIIRGGGGNDTIFGGTGSDTAKFDFAVASYNISASGSAFSISPKAGFLQFEGTDQVGEIEVFDFGGTTYSAAQLTAIASGTTTTPTSTDYGDDPGGGSISRRDANLDILDTSRTTALAIAGTSANPASPFVSTIGIAGDRDYVKIYLVQGATYRVLVEGVSANGMGALADTFFRIRDGRDASVLNPLALAPTDGNTHDQAVGNNAQVDFVAPFTGNYFISVGAGGASYETLTGGYRLTASLITPSSSLPANHNPVANTDSFEAVLGKTINGNVLGNDTDQDANVLGVDVVSSLTTTRGGLVDILPNGVFQYIAPLSGGSGTDQFAYTVRDGAGGNSQGTVTIQLVQPSATLPQVPEFTNGSDVVNIPVVPAGAGWIFYALDGNDILTGSPGHGYQVFGGEGDDTFYAAGQGGVLHGGPGNDLFVPSAAGGNEYFDGDTYTEFSVDSDTVDFSNQSSRLVANVGNGTGVVGASIFSLSLIENIIGTAFGDEIRGVGAGNTLSIDNVYTGLAGNDLLMGYVGNDDLYGGSDNDALYGGDGDDDLFGGDGNDDLHAGNGGASDGRNYLDGGAGDDSLYGGAQDDVLTGGDGNDFVAGDDGFGQPGNDRIIASAGTDRLRGLDGIDTADFSAAPGAATGGFSVTVSGWGTSTLEDMEIVIGTPFADNLNAQPGYQSMRLGAGDDFGFASGPMSMWGDDGSDFLFGTSADETFYGGLGNDRLYMNDGRNIGYGEDGDDIMLGGSGNDEFLGGDGNDFLFNGTGNASMAGQAGNDTLEGGSGADGIDAGDGEDRVIAQTSDGNDTMTGGNGFDVLDMSAVGGVVQVNQFAGTVTGSAGNDTLTDIFEQVIGTAFGDVLAGGNGINVLDGNGGADLLYGNGGQDLLRGGDGGDTFFMQTADGNDTIEGGAGFDLITFASAGGVIQLNMFTNSTTGTAGNDTFSGIEYVIGSNFGDIIAGNNGVNAFEGGGGADQLFGNGGVDWMRGGTGNDTVILGTGNDTYYFRNGDGVDTINDFVAGGTDDNIDLTTAATGYASFAAMQGFAGAIVQSGADTFLNLDPGGGSADRIILKNVTATNLTAADFAF